MYRDDTITIKLSTLVGARTVRLLSMYPQKAIDISRHLSRLPDGLNVVSARCWSPRSRVYFFIYTRTHTRVDRAPDGQIKLDPDSMPRLASSAVNESYNNRIRDKR